MRSLMFILLIVAAVLICGSGFAQSEGVELMPNPDLRTTAGWTAIKSESGISPRVIETRTEGTGNSTLHVASDSNPKVGWEWPGAGVQSPSFAAETGKTYRVSIRLRNPIGSAYASWHGGSGTTERGIGQFGAYAASESDGWETLAAEVTETAGGPQANIAFTCFGTGAMEFDLASISVKEVDRSPVALAAAWRSAFPGKDWVCWEKSPWLNTLRPTSMPPDGARECKDIRVAMGRTEYESSGFVITNLGDSPLECMAKAECPGVAVTVREGYWVPQWRGDSVCDALLLREDGCISVPAKENREVWLTFKTTNTQPGIHRGRVIVSASGKADKVIPIEAKVYPVTLPDEKPIYTVFWDYIVPKSDKDPRAAAFVADLRDHCVTVPVLSQTVVFQTTADGSLQANDYTVFDRSVKNYAPMKPKKYLFFWEGKINLDRMTNPDFLSPQWKTLFKEWLADWLKHIKGMGIGYDQFAMYPYDEAIDTRVAEVAKLIHEVDPKVEVFVNHTGENVEQVNAIKADVNVWCPFLYDLLNRPPYNRLQDVKAEAMKAFPTDPAHFWTYANPNGGTGPGVAPPYRDYRLSVWKAWQLGMGGYGVYTYTWYGKDIPWNPGMMNWQLVYAADASDAPPNLPKGELVIPSRRWEATREGIEDYCYLWMLQQATKSGKLKDSTAAKRLLVDLPKELLRYPEDTRRADRAKEQLLKALAGE